MIADYQGMATELRNAGVAAEVYLGSSGMKTQFKYADRRKSPVVLVAGPDEFSKGEVSIKDMELGRKLASDIEDHAKWKEQPAQFSVSRSQLVDSVKEVLRKHSADSD